MLFILTVVLYAIMAFCWCQIIGDAEHSKKREKIYQLTAKLLACMHMLIGVLNVFLGDKFGAFSKGYILLGVGAFFLCCLWGFSRRKQSEFWKFAVRTIAVVTILEVTLFNIPTFRLWSGSYPEQRISAEQAVIESGGEYDSHQKVIHSHSGEELVMLFRDINIPVGTVYTEANFLNDTTFGNYLIDLKDETSTGDYRYNIIETHILPALPSSQYLHVEASGAVSDIRIKIQPIDGEGIDISAVSFNVPIPLSVSWFRFLFLILSAFFVFCLFRLELMQKQLSQSNLCYNIIAVSIACVTCIIGISIWAVKEEDKENLWKQESGNQVTAELVDAFENGSVSLLHKPESTVIQFENIYDDTLRNVMGQQYEWDHVYYNGNYYSYYGIAPVILLFLPYHKLTGYYFPTSAAVLIFSIIGLWGLTALYSRFVKKFFPSLPLGDAAACLMILHAASGIWFSLGRMSFYEIATAAGFAFVTWGAYFLLDANIIGSGSISLVKTAFSSLFFAVAVLCRPTLVLYCICAAVFMLMALPRACVRAGDGKGRAAKLLQKSSIGYLLCAIVPMAVLGICQMWYNYARFENPFEFGIQYSLTINNFTATEWHWQLSMIPLFNYLFNPPVFKPVYPFIQTILSDMGVGGFFYFDNPQTYATSGIFWTVLPLFCYLLSKQALQQLPNRKTKLLTSAYVGIPCVLIPIVIIAMVWESGYATRYFADFSWELIFGAYTIMFFLYTKTQNETVKKLFRILICVSVFWAVIVGGVQIYGQAFRFYEYHYEWPEMFYKLEKLIQFWK